MKVIVLSLFRVCWTEVRKGNNGWAKWCDSEQSQPKMHRHPPQKKLRRRKEMKIRARMRRMKVKKKNEKWETVALTVTHALYCCCRIFVFVIDLFLPDNWKLWSCQILHVMVDLTRQLKTILPDKSVILPCHGRSYKIAQNYLTW